MKRSLFPIQNSSLKIQNLLRPYTATDQPIWDAFVRQARNGHFLFERGYMDYHADRFEDNSLMFYQGKKLAAVLPANRKEGVLYSHGGLTFGGWVVGGKMRGSTMIGCFEALGEYLRAQGMKGLYYKASPHIYHREAAEEDRYALWRLGAKQVTCNLSACLVRGHRPPYNKGRKWAVKQGAKHELAFRQSTDFAGFMQLMAVLLEEKYAAHPVHTTAEMELLAQHFPANIKLYAAYLGDEMLAGVIIYESPQVAHTQYIGANARGRELSALDSLIDYLINEVYLNHLYFDFGTSNEDGGKVLNEGLMAFKEGFGARGIAYAHYYWEL